MTSCAARVSFPLISSRNDLLLALALAALSVAQVLVWPIAWRPLGVAIALVSTLPIAWRVTHPAAAAVVGTLPWCVPTDGYVFVGFVAAFVLFYSLGAYVGDLRRVDRDHGVRRWRCRSWAPGSTTRWRASTWAR